ncbi:MAG: glycosyltransferase [Candidatus Wallbacteria bacterium]
MKTAKNNEVEKTRPSVNAVEDHAGAGSDIFVSTNKKINILFLINDLKIGGAEKMMLYLVSGLDLRIYNPIVCTLLDRGEYRDRVSGMGFKYYSLEMQSYFKVPLALFKLLKIISGENITIIHSYLFYSDIMARIAGWLGGVPIVITSMRNIDSWRKPPHIFIDSLTYTLSSAIISNSLAGAERLVNVERIPASKIKVVYNAIKLNEYKKPENYDRNVFRSSMGLSENDIAIVKVARLEEQKDHHTLLKAARSLLSQIESGGDFAAGKTLKFVLVGDGRMENELKSEAVKLGIDKNVIFLGRRMDIKEILHASDIFLMTSIYEGIPNSILEAQACGLPVIATDVGGVSEIIENNYNGFLCKPSEVQDIADKVKFVISSSELAKTIVANAFERLEQKFSQKNLIAKTTAIYKDLLIQCTSADVVDFFSPDDFKMKLNVLYFITSSDTGGAQKHLVALVKHFLRKNHQIKVVTSPGEPMNGNLRKLGIKPIILNYLQKKINPFYDFITFYQLSRILIENDFQIIHCHSTKAGIIGRLAAFFAGVPVKIFTAHGFVFHENMNFFKRSLCVLAEKIGGIFSDCIITVSGADWKKAVKNHIAPRRKLKLIQNGIEINEINNFSVNVSDENRKKWRGKYKISDNAIIIGSVGRLVYEKSYETAIKAFKKVSEKNERAVMLIAGGGYELRKLEGLIKKLGLESKVVLTGEIENIYEIYSIIDIFFLSSIKEGLPYSLLEAGAFGLFSVCTNAGGISDVIKTGKNGILCQSGNEDSFVDALLNSLDMPAAQRALMGGNLKNTIIENFTEEKMACEVEKTYFRLAAKKGLIKSV